jgi:hypothetical protein
MAINYLHDFGHKVKDAFRKFEGLATALQIENVAEYRKSEPYQNAIIDLRKKLHTTRFVSINSMVDFVSEHITDDILRLYSLEKGLKLVEELDINRDLIKTIMNKFDKNLRNSFDQEILNQYDITIKVNRSGEWVGDKDPFEDIRKVNYRTDNYYSTKNPIWTITVSFPVTAMQVIIDSQNSCLIPWELINTDTREISIGIHLHTYDMIQDFIDNADKIKEWSKKPELFAKRIFERSNDAISTRYRIANYWSGMHPYKSGQNWCYGTMEPLMNRSYRKGDFQALAIHLKNWFTTYDLQNARPYEHIESFYHWLPSTIENAHLMPHTEQQASNCWSSIDNTKKHQICRSRKCAFIETCVMYQNHEETTAQRNTSVIGSMFEYARDSWSEYLSTYLPLNAGTKQEIHREFVHISNWLEDSDYVDTWHDGASFSDMSEIVGNEIGFREYRTTNNAARTFIDQFHNVELYAISNQLRNVITETDYLIATNAIPENEETT